MRNLPWWVLVFKKTIDIWSEFDLSAFQVFWSDGIRLELLLIIFYFLNNNWISTTFNIFSKIFSIIDFNYLIYQVNPIQMQWAQSIVQFYSRYTSSFVFMELFLFDLTVQPLKGIICMRRICVVPHLCQTIP